MTPRVVEYMKTPVDAATLERLCGMLGLAPAGLLRKREAETPVLRGQPDQAVLDAMAAEPRLMERPIVVRGDRAAIGRPPENVLDIL